MSDKLDGHGGGPAMDPELPRSIGKSILRISATILACIAFYFASIGPAILFYRFFPGSEKILTTLYSPLAWVAQNTPLGEPLNVYAHWWEKL